MIWSRLKNNCCPKCNSLLQAKGVLDTMYECSKTTCDFSITSARFDEIIQDMYRPKRYQMTPNEYDNLAGLNNLGHAIPSQDFSDRTR